jgi:hypothetical protein
VSVRCQGETKLFGLSAKEGSIPRAGGVVQARFTEPAENPVCARTWLEERLQNHPCGSNKWASGGIFTHSASRHQPWSRKTGERKRLPGQVCYSQSLLGKDTDHPNHKSDIGGIPLGNPMGELVEDVPGCNKYHEKNGHLASVD